MEKPELIFGNFADSKSFIRDLHIFLESSQEELELIVDTFLKSKYRYYYHYRLKEFSNIINSSIEDAHKILHLLDLFAYTTVKKYEVDIILSAIEHLTSEKSNNMADFLNKLKDNEIQERLKTLDLIDDEIGTINPHYRTITFNIQNRIVVKDKEVIANIPIVTLQVNTTGKEKDNAIELTYDDLDKLIKELNEVKKRVNLLKKE